jgi:hypothetical protein
VFGGHDGTNSLGDLVVSHRGFFSSFFFFFDCDVFVFFVPHPIIVLIKICHHSNLI